MKYIRKFLIFILVIALALLPMMDAYALFGMPSVRSGYVSYLRQKPQGNKLNKGWFLSGSVLRKDGKDVNSPVAPRKDSAPHVEYTDNISGASLIPGQSVLGKRYEMDEHMVPGGFGPLKVVNGGKEPTGRKIVDFGKDTEAEFKVGIADIDEAAGTVTLKAYFRACIRNPVTKKWITCTPYFITSLVQLTLRQGDVMPIDIKTTVDKYKGQFTRPDKAIKDVLQKAKPIVQSVLSQFGGGGGQGTPTGTPLNGIPTSTSVAGNPGSVGPKGAAIVKAALSLQGTSSANGPEGGTQACAFMVNKVLVNAVGHTIGDNTNYVPSVEDDLRNGKGIQVTYANSVPGDILIAKDQRHIGICMDYGCNLVLSNSSSKARFSWQSDGNFDGAYDKYGGINKIYRVK
jgi:hypothetical protein